MPEPIVSAIVLGVAGNLATNVVQNNAGKLRRTKLGRGLSKAGLITSTLDQTVERGIKEAAQQFLVKNTSYNIKEVHGFLKSHSLSAKIAQYILHGESPDIDGIIQVLSQYMGFPVSEAPEGWPNKIDPWRLVEGLLSCLKAGFGESADPGLIWIASNLADARTEIDQLRRNIDRLPQKISEMRVGVEKSADDVFEISYLNHLSTRFLRVVTPGARELMGLQQSLEIAYISLNLTSSGLSDEVRAESFLAQNIKVAIKGPAGSGKTTLLNWITTQCAANRQNKSSQWFNLVPFFIPLRKIARIESGAPSVSRFLDYSVDEGLWTGEAPSEWLNKILVEDQRAIVMIDGVDELPPPRRAEFWTWLDGFCRAYPGNRIIVTSRALPQTSEDTRTDQWNPPSEFVEAKLQDMSNADVTRFVLHWHDAIDKSTLTTTEKQSLDDARRSLPIKLEDAANRRIRELCNTPLLCAMVCVLHWREEGYLPKIRVDLYDKCCDMLIEARDLKRGLEPPEGPLASLSKNDKEMVLQRLAFDMISNKPDGDIINDDSYRIEISRAKAIAWISTKIASFQYPDARAASPDEVLDFLIERTGLLREPALDLIDFPHRTFQEYLAACAAGADSQEDLLAKQADDDQWHETIMLAAGTPTGGVGFGRRLIDALIRRGERHRSLRARQQRVRKMCFALALGCLENLRQHDPELRQRVLSNLGELVPPREEQDSRILAVAGDAAVSHLEYSRWKDENTATVAACARALRLIGTAEALSALDRGYREDSREQVVSEVCRTGIFPYFQIPLVVRQVAESGRVPRFAETSNLELLVGLEGLRTVHVNGGETADMTPLARLPDIESLSAARIDISDPSLLTLSPKISSLTLHKPIGVSTRLFETLTGLTRVELFAADNFNFDCLSGHDSLEHINIISSSGVRLDFLNSLPSLRTLRLVEMEDRVDLGAILPLADLQTLVLSECAVESFRPIAEFVGLECLVIENMGPSRGELSNFGQSSRLTQVALVGQEITSLDCFSDLRSIESFVALGLRDLASIDGLRSSSGLRELALVQSPCIDVIPFREFAVLEDLQISSVANESLRNIGDLSTSLRSLNIGRLDNFDFARIAHCRSLSKLALDDVRTIEGVGSASRFENLRELVIGRCGVSELAAFSGSPIEQLSLHSLPNLDNLDFLTGFKDLKTLTIMGCPGIIDLSCLAGMDSLSRIIIYSDSAVKVPELLRPRTHQYPFYHLPWDEFGPGSGFSWYNLVSNLPFTTHGFGIGGRIFYERAHRRRRFRLA